MIDTYKYEGVTRFDLVEQHNIHELAIFLLDQLAEVKRLREAIADIAINMEAADESYMGGFIKDLREVIE